MDHSDENLLRGCRDGAGWAIRAISDFITPLIRRGVYASDDWEDVRQESLIKIVAAFKKVPSVRNPWGLARKIAVCNAVDYNRRFKTEGRHVVRQSVLSQEAGDSPGASAANVTSDPTSDFESADLFLYVFQQLEDICQEIIKGLFMRGQSYMELSSELGLSEGNLRIRLMRCREKARQIRSQLREED